MQCLCDSCGSEGLADVWYELPDGTEVSIIGKRNPDRDDSPLIKRVARECPDCGNYWEYTGN